MKDQLTLFNNIKIRWAIIVGVVVVGGIIWILQAVVGSVSVTRSVAEGRYSLIDGINQAPVPVKLDSEITKQEVYKMPVLVLALPDQNWFTQTQMQLIARAVGLTSQASVQNLGVSVVWQEGLETLVIDPTMGVITFSTAFNLDRVVLPELPPTAAIVSGAVDRFFEVSQLSISNFWLDQTEIENWEVSTEGDVGPSVSGSGQLVRVSLPMGISGVQVVTPIESYMVVDGAGRIRLLSVLVPHLKQQEELVTLVSWNEARKRVERGDASIVKLGVADPSQLTVDSSFPAYYMGMKDFYTLSKRREFRPVYVFAGENSKLIVDAGIK